MKSSVIVDTNVAVVANGRSRQANPECVLACVDVLVHIQNSERVVFDLGYRIIDEYRRRLSPSGQPGVGDAFFKWVWQNQANPECCEVVEIHTRPGSVEDYEEFPDDSEFTGFDPSDRKFVAVSRASPSQPPILNAVDSDWLPYHEAFARHGVQVTFLCPGLPTVKRDRPTRSRTPKRPRP